MHPSRIFLPHDSPLPGGKWGRACGVSRNLHGPWGPRHVGDGSGNGSWHTIATNASGAASHPVRSRRLRRGGKCLAERGSVTATRLTCARVLLNFKFDKNINITIQTRGTEGIYIYYKSLCWRMGCDKFSNLIFSRRTPQMPKKHIYHRLRVDVDRCHDTDFVVTSVVGFEIVRFKNLSHPVCQ